MNFYLLTIQDEENNSVRIIKLPKQDHDMNEMFVECYNDVSGMKYKIINTLECIAVLEENEPWITPVKTLLLEMENSGQPVSETAKFQYSIRGMREFWEAE